MADNDVPRRSFLKGAGAAGTLVATALTGAIPGPADAQTPSPSTAPVNEPVLTLTSEEAAFFSPASLERDWEGHFHDGQSLEIGPFTITTGNGAPEVACN